MCDILVLCAVENEYRTLCESLENSIPMQSGGKAYVRGEWLLQDRRLRVAVRRGQKGDVHAGAETRHWIEILSPTMMTVSPASILSFNRMAVSTPIDST